MIYTNARQLFETKEHYLAFRQAWKDYINSGKHKLRDGYGDSSLTSAHHLLYAILRERDVTLGFKNQRTNDCGAKTIDLARSHLRWLCKFRMDVIKEPFGDTLSDELLQKVRNMIESEIGTYDD